MRRPRYAYVEFAESEHVDAALSMDNSLFRGRLIKVWRDQGLLARRLMVGAQVTSKRTNIPGFNRGRGRGGSRGGYRGGYRGYGGYSPYGRGRGR
jgi:polyadenylate-binding protein 2